MKFILASSNAGKAQELIKNLGSLNIEIEPADQKLEVVEDGSSFAENALLKAQAYYDHYQKPVVSDDSGLSIEALPSELGVHSARFAEHLPKYTEKCRYLLDRLIETKAQSREAHFQCVLCFYFSPEEYFFFEGKLSGTIASDLKGEGGFGYDPIFIPEGESFTLAENPEWKLAHSHRSNALAAAHKFFQGYLSR